MQAEPPEELKGGTRSRWRCDRCRATLVSLHVSAEPIVVTVVDPADRTVTDE
jgi:hypothetical protein